MSVNINMNNERNKDIGHWEIPENLDVSNFNFTWRPDPFDPPFIHQFGTQWQRSGGPKFIVPDSIGVKYQDCQKAIKLPEPEKFKILVDSEVQFDFSWHPDEAEPPFIWTFGNQFHQPETMPTIEYVVGEATDRKYVYDLRAHLLGNKKYWYIKDSIDITEFDFTWHPNPVDPPFIYAWGNKWVPAEVKPTIEYRIPNATQYKYMGNEVKILPIMDNWTVYNENDKTTFDFSWRPNPLSQPYIYQWENNGPTYTVPGATEVKLMQRDHDFFIVPKYYIKTTLEDLINEHITEVFWAINPDLNYDKFDFKWKPSEENFKHINVFGNETSKDTQTYYVNGPMVAMGFKDFNYIDTTLLDIDTKLSMFYIDTGNSNCTERFNKLKEKYPQIQKTRFINSWVDTVTRCIKKTETKLLWVLCSDLDYDEFEFDFYPTTWQMDMIHVFGTQYSHWGNTYLINSEMFIKDTKLIKIIEHLKNINHVHGKTAKTLVCKYDILNINHGNNNFNLAYLKTLGKHIFETSYQKSYLYTILTWLKENRGIIKNYIWVTSSICNYEQFDFSWHFDPFKDEQIHVFSSEFNKSRQKFGDTFLINIQNFLEYAESLNKLEEYKKEINYIEYITVPRLPHPIYKHNYDSQVDGIKHLKEEYFPYYELHTPDFIDTKTNILNLWEENKSTIIVGSKGASQITVPHIAINKINNEIYDYPFIDKAKILSNSRTLDIVFISNGEPCADENYNTLINSLKKRKLTNRVVRIQDINGRIASQHAAANLSNTSWYFLVNGKVKVNDTFNWEWQPDRLQQPKHYIFTVSNPVNSLIYGHQAIVANNKALTLNTVKRGLDFTLDSLHEVVDMNCGVAVYNTDPWTTWRTAFRESIKLRNNDDPVSKFRLDRWTSTGKGDYADISRQGALDGIEYWEMVNGNLEKLLLTYDWEWISKYYKKKYDK